jgi:hypothetical protein
LPTSRIENVTDLTLATGGRDRKPETVLTSRTSMTGVRYETRLVVDERMILTSHSDARCRPPESTRIGDRYLGIQVDAVYGTALLPEKNFWMCKKLP